MATKTYTFEVAGQSIDIEAHSGQHARYKLVEMFDKFDEPFPAVLTIINIEKLLAEKANKKLGKLQT